MCGYEQCDCVQAKHTFVDLSNTVRTPALAKSRFMLIISTVPEAIGLMIAGVFLLGTWPAVWNLIEQRGKTPSHIFLDYSITYLIFATIVALTLGQLGPATTAAAADGSSQSNFLDQLHQPNGKLVAFAVSGGFCLALGDLGMQYATAILGLSIGPPLLNALTVIIGVVLAYFIDGGINKPQLVFSGMACAALAIAAGAAAHLINARSRRVPMHQQQQQQQHRTHSQGHAINSRAPAAVVAAAVCDDLQKAAAADCVVDVPVEQQQQQECDLALQKVVAEVKLEEQRSISAAGRSKFLGLAIAVAGGVIYGLFLPAFQIAATDPFGLLPVDVAPLSVYTTYFYFAAAFTTLSLVTNLIFLYKPPLGTASSSVSCYLRDNNGRGLAILSGLLAAAGDLTQFIGGQTAGYAACMLVMAYPVVGVVWGQLRFKELKQGSKMSNALIAVQVVCYVTAVGLLAGSAELRQHDTSSQH